MRCQVLHVSAALLTFTAGFLAAATSENLAYALPVALALFVIVAYFKRFRVPPFDFLKFKVATLTLLLWIPLLAIFLPLIVPQSGLGNCEPDFTEDEVNACAIPISPQRVPEDTIITLERTGCYGRCPRYTLSIFSDGSVVFYRSPRNGFTKVTGAARGWISQAQLRGLVSEFERVGYFSFKDRYETVADGCSTVWTDSPSVITSLQIKGRKKTVYHYHGCTEKGSGWAVFPQDLTDLENRIDEAAGSGLWVE